MNQLFTHVVIAEQLYWVPRMCIAEENDLISFCALYAYFQGRPCNPGIKLFPASYIEIVLIDFDIITDKKKKALHYSKAR